MKRLISFVFFAISFFPIWASADEVNRSYLELDGSGDYLAISDSAQTGLDGMEDLTVEMWIKLESLPSSGVPQSFVIKSKFGSWNWASYGINLENNSGVYKLNFVTAGSGYSSQYHYIWKNPQVGIWYHIAGTYDGSTGHGSMYMNGIQVVSDTQIGFTINDTAEPVAIGAGEASGTPNHFFHGAIDEVRIWSSVRTPQEINKYKDIELTGHETSLEGYWKFNQDPDDETPNENDMTEYGGATYTTNNTSVLLH